MSPRVLVGEINGKTDIDKSVRGIVDIIESATLVDSGSFLKWTGEKIPF